MNGDPTPDDRKRADGWSLAIATDADIWTHLSAEQQQRVRARIAWAYGEEAKPAGDPCATCGGKETVPHLLLDPLPDERPYSCPDCPVPVDWEALAHKLAAGYRIVRGYDTLPSTPDLLKRVDEADTALADYRKAVKE